jgi:hypothetical protein
MLSTRSRPRPTQLRTGLVLVAIVTSCGGPTIPEPIAPGGAPANTRSLIIELPASCPAGTNKRRLIFDGWVVSTPSVVQFTLPIQIQGIDHNDYDAGPIRADLIKTGDVVSGTLGQGPDSFSRDREGYLVSVFSDTSRNAPALLSGNLVNPDRIEGTFSGFVHVAHPSFGLATSTCSTTYAWSISARVDH